MNDYGFREEMYKTNINLLLRLLSRKLSKTTKVNIKGVRRQLERFFLVKQDNLIIGMKNISIYKNRKCFYFYKFLNFLNIGDNKRITHFYYY